MVGREPRTADSVFGIRQEDGFDIPFFSGVTIEILQGGGLQILKPGEAKFVGLPPMQVMTPGPMDMHEMSMNGFMPVVGPRGFLKFLFVVPSPACLMGGAATDSRIRRGLVTKRQSTLAPGFWSPFRPTETICRKAARDAKRERLLPSSMDANQRRSRDYCGRAVETLESGD